MASTLPTQSWQFVEQHVAAYESARASLASVDLSEFLPATTHPQFLTVLGELIRVDLELGWRCGDPPKIEDYRERFPALFADRERLADVAYEEYRLRLQAGQVPRREEYASHFGVDTSKWGGGGDVSFPTAGERLGEFNLLCELGCGAFAHVYLARQTGLADRLVALKVSSSIPVESQTLAQLQHTHIMPVYSAHAFGPWQALCMPYLGATTLADLCGELRHRGSVPARGSDLIDTVVARRDKTLPLDQLQTTLPSSPWAVAARSPEDKFAAERSGEASIAPPLAPYQELTYVESILWIVARAAEGLAHAHARGIVHQDLKPANILLADDGRPMLLDFNLSTDVKRIADAHEVLQGGTLPYMAPEQIAALLAGRPLAAPQSDVYSLGVILYELLTGRSPFPLPTDSPEFLRQAIEGRRRSPVPLRSCNRALTPAVESIVERCVAFDLAGRYGSADMLREDIDRHLARLPLRHASNSSIVERITKFSRRNRWLTTTAAPLAAAALAVVVLVGALLARQARLASLEAAASAREAVRDAQMAQLLLSQPAIEDEELAEALRETRTLAERFDLLHVGGPARSPVLARVPEHERRRVVGELGRVARLWRKHLERAIANSAPDDPDRAAWKTTIGQLQSAAPALHSLSSRSAAEVEMAYDAIFSGQASKALEGLRRVTRESPTDFTAWALLGGCLAARGDEARAAECYTVCRSLCPDSVWPLYYRGQAYYRRGDYAAALCDFELAEHLRPMWSRLAYHRALTHLALNEPAAALKQLDRALAQDEIPKLRLYCLKARIHRALGKLDAAEHDLAAALAITDVDKVGLVARGVARLQMRNDVDGAAEDFDAALAIDPSYRPALEDKAHVLSERLGRTEDAIGVLSRTIDMHSEYTAARAGRGVLLARLGRRAAAHTDAKEALRLSDEPSNLYQVAGIYALTSREAPEDRDEALRLLRSALRQGFGHDLLRGDQDLDPLRQDPEFEHLLNAAGAMQRPRRR